MRRRTAISVRCTRLTDAERRVRSGQSVRCSASHTHPAKAPYSLFKQASDTVRSGVIIGLGSPPAGIPVRTDQENYHPGRNRSGASRPGSGAPTSLLPATRTVPLIFWQACVSLSALSKLVRYADKTVREAGSRFPVHILGEEFTACGTIPDLSRRLSVIRSRNISMSCVFQNLAGLQNRYPPNLWQEILGNCDAQLFLAVRTALQPSLSLSAPAWPRCRYPANPSSWAPGAFPTTLRNSGKLLALASGLCSPRMKCCDCPSHRALVIIRGQKVLKVDKMDYSKHPEAPKLHSCKASSHIPEWRQMQQEQPAAPAAPPPPPSAPKKPARKSPSLPILLLM